MLRIGEDQLAAFRTSAWQAFEDEMIEHAQEFSPTLTSVIGKEQTRRAVREMIGFADEQGFALCGPIRLCIELMLMCGSGFAFDPQYPGIGKALRGGGSEMARAKRMQSAHDRYIDAVVGLGNANVLKALQTLASLRPELFAFEETNLGRDLAAMVYDVFPQRAAYMGEGAVMQLVTLGRNEAVIRGIPSLRGQTLMVALMCGFGCGCASDPLYPWIRDTLGDERIADTDSRIQRLERKALTWLNHVLGRFERNGAI